MRMIESVNVTRGMMLSSTVPEDDAPVWESATTYAKDATVIRDGGVYLSLKASNTDNDPLTDAAQEWWAFTGATNRWRAFDKALAPPTTYNGEDDLVYVMSVTRKFDCVALFGLMGSDLIVTVRDGDNEVQYTEEIPLSSSRVLTGWWDYFFEPFSITPSVILREVPAFVGWTVEIRISGGGTLAVSEIFLGISITLGESLVNTAVGFRDFSIKERDPWGGWQIAQRGYSRTVDYHFTLSVDDVERAFQAVLRNRAKMCIFDAGPNTDHLGTTVIGFVNEDGLSIPITTGYCFATLSVEGLSEE